MPDTTENTVHRILDTLSETLSDARRLAKIGEAARVETILKVTDKSLEALRLALQADTRGNK